MLFSMRLEESRERNISSTTLLPPIRPHHLLWSGLSPEGSQARCGENRYAIQGGAQCGREKGGVQV